MGQHKYNPTAQLAAEGKILPKKRKISRKEAETIIKRALFNRFYKKHLDLPLGKLKILKGDTYE